MRNCVPAGWAAATLDELASIIRGVTFPASAKLSAPTEDSVICLRTSNVQRDLEYDDVLHIAQSYVKRDEQWLQDGDTVISIANSYELVGKVAYAKSPSPRTTIGGFISIIRSRGIDPRFLHYQLASTVIQEEMRRTASTTVNISNLSLRGIRPLPVVSAPLAEQHRLVEAIESYLTRLDDAVASLERVQRNLERYRASVLKAAVEGRLVPTEAELAREEGRSYEPASELLKRLLAERKARWIEDAVEKARAKSIGNANALLQAEKKYKDPALPDTSNLPDLPEGWCWCSFDQLGIWSSGGTPRRGDASYYGGSIPWYKTGELHDGILPWSEETLTELGLRHSSAKVFPRGTLLVAMYGATIGMTGLLNHPGSTNQACAALLPAVPETLGFIWQFVISSRKQLKSVGQGGAQPNISQTLLKLWPMPLPPLAEQERIVRKTEELLSVRNVIVEAAARAIRKSQALRQSILKWAFEGKLVEQDPNDEPASALLERIKAECEAAEAAAPKRRRKKGKGTWATTPTT